MHENISAIKNLEYEARSLIARQALVKPFSLNMPMVVAAALPTHVLNTVEAFFNKKRRENHQAVYRYLAELKNMTYGGYPCAATAQKLFTTLRMRFNCFLSQYDIFADVISQRGEHENGVLLSGLDEAARDAMCLPGSACRIPPIMCYIEKGFGAAIRRVQTRLPGGDRNPATIIRIPRERMVSGCVASSLVHEVGHQGSAFLDLVSPLRRALEGKIQTDTDVMRFFHLWIPEILSDLWSVSKIGIGSTLGLISVISLPARLVFRIGCNDSHPAPWIRVKISCALGHALYPDKQWMETAAMWETLYPLNKAIPQTEKLFRNIERRIPEVTDLIMGFRPVSLKGKTLYNVFAMKDRMPSVLRNHYIRRLSSANRLENLPPTLAFAVLGQARHDGMLSPERECKLIETLLKGWALSKNEITARHCRQ